MQHSGPPTCERKKRRMSDGQLHSRSRNLLPRQSATSAAMKFNLTIWRSAAAATIRRARIAWAMTGSARIVKQKIRSKLTVFRCDKAAITQIRRDIDGRKVSAAAAGGLLKQCRRLPR